MCAVAILGIFPNYLDFFGGLIAYAIVLGPQMATPSPNAVGNVPNPCGCKPQNLAFWYRTYRRFVRGSRRLSPESGGLVIGQQLADCANTALR